MEGRANPKPNVVDELVFDSLDSEYLKKHLGMPLTLALAEIVAKKPTDPIHYLGHWLMKWRYNQEYKQKEIDKVNELSMERVKMAEQIAEMERIEAEKEVLRQAEQEALDDRKHVAHMVEGLVHTSLSVAEKDEDQKRVHISEAEVDLRAEARDAFEEYDVDEEFGD